MKTSLVAFMVVVLAASTARACGTDDAPATYEPPPYQYVPAEQPEPPISWAWTGAGLGGSLAALGLAVSARRRSV